VGHQFVPQALAEVACSGSLFRRGRLVVVVDVGLTGVLALEVLVRHVRMVQRRVVVLVLVRGAEVLEAAGHLVVVVRDMEVPVRVHQPFVVVFFPPGRGRVFGHG
jgi:hypothetical protein